MIRNILRLATLSLLTSAALACSGTVEPADAPGDGDGSTGDGDGSTGDGDGSTGDGDGDGGVTLGTPSSPGGDWTLIQACDENAPTDPVNIEAVEITESTLSVEFGHGGGCETHSYALCYEELWLESAPVQIGLQLLHDANGDTCEAYLGGELEFDLTPLENAYNDAYQADGGTISLSLGDQRFTHSFGAVDAPTLEELEAAIDELNSCEVVEDCVALPTTPCSNSTFINKDADTSEVTPLIEAYNRANGFDGDWACTDDCQCGVLTCDAGKCVTAGNDCVTEPENGRMICL